MQKEQNALFDLCLHLGDNALVHSYRLSEWCSNAPLLEEDLALTNFALDMIGRAQALLTYAAQVEGAGRTDDMLAYRRGERSFYNSQIVELPNGTFAFSILRLFLVSSFEYSFYTALSTCTDAQLAAIAAKTVKEVKYHMVHSREWVLRLGDGTAVSHAKIQAALDELWPYTGELFQTIVADEVLCEKNIIPSAVSLHADWYKYVTDALTEATLAIPSDSFMHTGGRTGIHTEYLGHILSEMQYLQRVYPDAVW